MKLATQASEAEGERNRLIVQELPQVHQIASRIYRRLPRQIELGDLVHAGIIGLIEAHGTFNKDKNTQFKTYARFRITGAILDSLRALDWGSRGIRLKARQMAEASQRLEASLCRHPLKEELAAEMGCSISQLNDVQTHLDRLHLVRQEAVSLSGGEDSRDPLESARSSWDSPFEAYCKVEERLHLITAIQNLSTREQLILGLYYEQELTMKEVAQVIGLGVSRVSGVHFGALTKLKALLNVRAPIGVEGPSRAA